MGNKQQFGWLASARAENLGKRCWLPQT